jgi:hypothetical protein
MMKCPARCHRIKGMGLMALSGAILSIMSLQVKLLSQVGIPTAQVRGRGHYACNVGNVYSLGGAQMTLTPPPDNIFQIAWEFWPCMLLLALRFSQSCKLQRDFVKAANCSEYLSWLISSLD